MRCTVPYTRASARGFRGLYPYLLHRSLCHPLYPCHSLLSPALLSIFHAHIDLMTTFSRWKNPVLYSCLLDEYCGSRHVFSLGTYAYNMQCMCMSGTRRSYAWIPWIESQKHGDRANRLAHMQGHGMYSQSIRYTSYILHGSITTVSRRMHMNKYGEGHQSWRDSVDTKRPTLSGHQAADQLDT